MVSQSRLYFALLASVATMAFWMGMWSSTVSQNSKFTNPKPYRVILYYSGVENSSQISSGGKKKFCFLCTVPYTCVSQIPESMQLTHNFWTNQNYCLFLQNLTTNN